MSFSVVMKKSEILRRDSAAPIQLLAINLSMLVLSPWPIFSSSNRC